jgi:thiamine-phosphate pyrophosphorylase
VKVARPRIILITDPAFDDDFIVRRVQVVAASLPPEWLCVQLRDKRRPRLGLRSFADRLRAVTRPFGALLVINGDAQLARDVGADGIHLGREACTVGDARRVGGEDAWVSIAAHSDDAVRSGVAAGANAVLVSPVFDTRPPSSMEPVKRGRGVEALRSACEISGGRAAIFALGGVTPDNARCCIDAGADGVAMMRGLLSSAEPGRAARALHDAVAERC